MAEPADERSSCSPRRWRLWIVLGCTVFLCATLGRFAYRRIALRPTPRPAYWEAKLAALDPPPPGVVPAGEAAALVTAPSWEGDPALTNLSSFHPAQLLEGSWTVPRPDVAAASQLFTSAGFQDARREVLRVLESGWAEPISLDPLAFSGNLGGHRRLCYWLLAHSRWAREEIYDPATAAEDWLAALRVARQVRRRQTTIPLLVESGIMRLVAGEMMMAAREGLTPRDTRELIVRVENTVGPPRGPRELFAGDYLAARCELEYVFVREGGQWMDVAEMVRFRGPGWLGLSGPLSPSRLWNLASPLYHDLPETTRRLECQWAELAGCVDLAACRRVQQKVEADPQIRFTSLDGCPWDTQSGGTMLTTVRVASLHYEAMCSLDAAFAMLALEAFHRRHDLYPESLDELVPDYLPRPPLDYADRRPLRYRRTNDGCLLYSIGADGADDGGRSASSEPYQFSADHSDVVFTAIHREPERR